MAKTKGFIKELGTGGAKALTKEPTFGWNKSVVPARQPESGNLHRRSTMQAKAPTTNSNISEEHASVRAKRR